VTTSAIELGSPFRSSLGWASRISLSSISLLIFCAAFLSYAYTTRGVLDWMGIPAGSETLQVARTLATTGRYADPFGSIQAHSGYTAHLAPVYPAILAAIFRGIGDGLASLTVLWAANLVFIAVQLALLPVISSELGLGTLPGVIGAVLGILFPQYTVDFVWESLLTGVELVLLCLLTQQILNMRRSWLRVSLLGALSGVAILTNPVTVLVLGAWALAASFSSPPGERRATIKTCAIIVGIAAVVCAPWIVRNKIRLGGFFLIRDNMGLELSVSNNDCAAATLRENLESGCQRIVHPSRNFELTKQIAAMGEYQFNQIQLHQALGWIAQNPKHFASLTVQRFVLFWFPVKGLAPFRRFPAAVWVTTLISLFGFVQLWNRKRDVAWFLGGTLFFYPLIYYIVQFEPRYRDPIMWISLLLAGYGLTELLKRTALFRGLQNP
jgi:hypothetical protein